jgi:DNA-binding NarL/FixJ family response regulator
LREICHLAPNSDEEATVKAALAEAHSNLDSSRFSQNWSQGRTVSLEEVLQLALLSSKTGLDTVNVGFDLNLSLKRARRSKIGGPVMRLTPRELEVLRLVATGMTDAQVAENLGLSTLTVSSYLRSIYSKLGVTSRTAAVHAARARNLVGT